MKIYAILLNIILVPLLVLAQNVPSNTLRIGNGAASNKRIIFNRGSSNPEFRWDESSGKIKFSNNGSSFLEFGAQSDPQNLNNVSFAASISSNTLVVALKGADGTDPSASNPVVVSFRSSTATTGTYSQTTFSAANSITAGTTASLACQASSSCWVFVYLIQDSTPEICLSGALLSEGALQSATATPATSASALYCTNNHSSKPVRLIGRVSATWSNPNWSAITNTDPFPFHKSGGRLLAVQRFTSGSGTWAPTNPSTGYIKIIAIGGGGGGSGGGSAGTGGGSNGGAGGSTTFGSLITAANGAGGVFDSNGGAGGSVTVSSPAQNIASVAGVAGSASMRSGGFTTAPGQPGGNSCFGGGGLGTHAAGAAGATNSGGGGAGGSSSGGGDQVYAAGGGAGGCVRAVMFNPPASISYSVGSAGSAGSAASSGFAGGAGAAGLIVVEEYE